MTVTVPKNVQKAPEVPKQKSSVDLSPNIEDMPIDVYTHTARYTIIKSAVIKRAGGTCEACANCKKATRIFPRHGIAVKSPFICDHVAVCEDCFEEMLKIQTTI